MTNLLDGIQLSELRGRKQRELTATPVRPVTEADLAVLRSAEKGSMPRPIMRLRDRHHAIARMVANGMSNGQISLVSGMDPSRISILRSDPTFRQLVDDYRSIEESLQADFMERAATLTLTAMDAMQEALESDEPPPVTTALEIAKFGSDRIGHGPVTKTSNVNLNVELSSRLSQARKRAFLVGPDEAANGRTAREESRALTVIERPGAAREARAEAPVIEGEARLKPEAEPRER
jgi:hypothetical protein